MRALFGLVFCLSPVAAAVVSCGQREKMVQKYNVHRNSSSPTTPLQVGNGNFAFSADITGLQTFSPFGILSSWGWHNFSLPTTANQTSVDDFTGLDWWTHGRLVNYDQPNPAESDISNWLIQNPQRVNLARIGFSFGYANVTESDLLDKAQTLDLWSGGLASAFVYNGTAVSIETFADPTSDTVAVRVQSSLLETGLKLVIDFPYPDLNKFDAPFVGVWNSTAIHTTTLQVATENSASIQHTIDSNSYYTHVAWADAAATISGPLNGTHRYFLTPGSDTIDFVVSFSPSSSSSLPTFDRVSAASCSWWRSFWSEGAFVDLSAVQSSDADELQRRIILSQYLTAVNSASSDPPQESGLVNNGWYGKFHLEMVLWHSLHFARWNRFPLLWRSTPSTYQRFLSSSRDRARQQGYAGARWGKMSDPTGRSAPGEINSLLIWQQPHPMYFAEIEYRSFPNATTLARWDEIITATADFMASFAWWNETTNVYDLGPPMYPVSESTPPNSTVNPTFELAYWRFGLDVAARWKTRQNQAVPASWLTVRDNLAPLPVENDTFVVYEGIQNMWVDKTTMYDHPAMAGVYGLLPPPASGPSLNLSVVRNTAEKILQLWDLEDSYGWDFAMLAMNSLRLGDVDQAISYLLHPIFQFNDHGYPVGGSRVPTPYFPNAAGLLLAVAMMAGGWDGQATSGPHFPASWVNAVVDGFVPGL